MNKYQYQIKYSLQEQVWAILVEDQYDLVGLMERMARIGFVVGYQGYYNCEKGWVFDKEILNGIPYHAILEVKPVKTNSPI